MVYLLDNRTGQKGEPNTLFSYRKDGEYIFFVFIAYDSSLESYSSIKNDTLYKGDVVEVFLDLGDAFYYEIEIAPNGTIFVAKILNRQIEFINDSFLKSKVTINKNNYRVEMEIDLSKLKPNSHVKFNAFRIETKGVESEYILQSLSPTLCDTFHVKNKFISI